MRVAALFWTICLHGGTAHVSYALLWNPRPVPSASSSKRLMQQTRRPPADAIVRGRRGPSDEAGRWWDPAAGEVPLRHDPTRVRYRCRVAYDGTSYCGFQMQGGRHSGSIVGAGLPFGGGGGGDEGPLPMPPVALKNKTRHQTENQRTVQGILEEVLSRRFQRPVTVVGAGRTDAGVHARGQAVHFDLFSHNETDVATSASAGDDSGTSGGRSRTVSELETSMNRMLPTDVRVWNLQPAPPPSFLGVVPRRSASSADLNVNDGDDGDDGDDDDAFDPPFVPGVYKWNVMRDCVSKLYSYRICVGDVLDPVERHNRWHPTWGHDIDVARLERTLRHYEGRHDFVCFSGALERNGRRRTGSIRARNTVRTVHSIELVKEASPSLDEGGDHCGHLYRIDVYLDGALYKMVRNMVGTALDVCRGRLAEETFLDLLHRPGELKYSRRDNPCKPAQPAGLTLERVFYPDDGDF